MHPWLCSKIYPSPPTPTRALPFPGLSVVPGRDEGMTDYLKVSDQLFGLDLNVHLVLALVPLKQLLIGQLKGDLAASSHIDGHCELLQFSPRGPG